MLLLQKTAVRCKCSIFKNSSCRILLLLLSLFTIPLSWEHGHAAPPSALQGLVPLRIQPQLQQAIQCFCHGDRSSANLKLRGGADTSQDMSQPSEYSGEGLSEGHAGQNWQDEGENLERSAEPPAQWLEDTLKELVQDERSKGMNREDLEFMARAFWKQSVMDEAQLTQVRPR